MYLGRGLDWDVLLLLITDDAYSPSIEEEIPNLRPRERMRALEDHMGIVADVLDEMAGSPYYGRKTNDFIMDRIMKRLARHGVKAPRIFKTKPVDAVNFPTAYGAYDVRSGNTPAGRAQRTEHTPQPTLQPTNLPRLPTLLSAIWCIPDCASVPI